jgi:hypothetical protein
MRAGESRPLQGPEVTDNLTSDKCLDLEVVFEALLLVFGQEMEELLNGQRGGPLPEV